MPDTRCSYASSDGLEIIAYRWDSVGAPIGAVQLTHGMGEHALRYENLARALTARHLVVYAQDHRGHGATARSDDALGELGPAGWSRLIEDIGLLSATIRSDHPRLALLLIAHSMGSFAAQQYLLDHSGDVDAVVLTGTAALDLLEPVLDLDQPLDLAMFNAPFQPARTDFDWLTRDQSIVDAYLADPLCGFGIDTESAKAMFVGARRLAVTDELAKMRADLPLYIAVGESDPVNAGLALLAPLVDRYRSAGLSDVTVHTYPEARHEIFNETNRVDVITDLTDWIAGGALAGCSEGALGL
jgi:alpha-beta hydrolase superfamily lysophospholipase